MSDLIAEFRMRVEKFRLARPHRRGAQWGVGGGGVGGHKPFDGGMPRQGEGRGVGVVGGTGKKGAKRRVALRTRRRLRSGGGRDREQSPRKENRRRKKAMESKNSTTRGKKYSVEPSEKEP